MQHELGYFGNIWVRQNFLSRSGDAHEGHTHHFDHVTLLAKGSVRVEMEDGTSKEFKAPTFMVIRKENHHKITALEDDTLYYCVFALRNINGEVVEDIFGEQHDPNSAGMIEDDYWAKVKTIQNI